jgi:DNA-binding response OmpR family regulator
VGGLEIDLGGRRATLEGAPLALTRTEFDLLALLAAEPGTVVSRQRILREVWDTEWFGPTKTVDVHVASLRKKLGDPAWIETVRGVGLRLVPKP